MAPARWLSRVESNFTLGMIRDTPRTGIPDGGLYEALDVFVHRPGVLFKRGGVQYAGPKMTGFSATAGRALAYAPFPSGPKLVALGNDAHCYLVTDSTTTAVANAGETTDPIDKPTFFSSGAEAILVFTDKSGLVVPSYYDGASSSSQLFPGGPTDITTGGAVVATITVELIGSPTGGTFRLACSNVTDPASEASPLLFITPSIAYNASAATVKARIDTALVATGLTCTATGGPLPGTPVVVTPAVGTTLSVWPSALTGGSSPYPKLTNTTASSDTTDPVSVPLGRFSESHLQRLLLANSAQYPQRLWFSPTLNVTRAGWDLANSWIDIDAPITGLGSLAEALLVFSANGMHRLTGIFPPPDTDMTLEPISEIGCTDARSITISEGRCIFANPSGVYITGGVGPVSLMEDRVESYWQSLFSGYLDPLSTGTSWTITTGIYARRFLFVTVLNGTSLVQTLICDLPRRAWTRCSTIDAVMYGSSVGVVEDLYFVNQGNNRVCKTSGLFSPSSTVKNDVGMSSAETATPVTCSWQTRPLAAGQGLKAFGDAEVLLDMRDAASDNPTLAVTVAPGVEATTAAATAESPLAETTDMARRRVTVSKDSECVTLGFAQANASSKTECYGIEWSERPYSPFAEGQ